MSLFIPTREKIYMNIFYVYGVKYTHQTHLTHQFMRLEIIARLARRFEVLKNKPFGLVGFNILPPVENIFIGCEGAGGGQKVCKCFTSDPLSNT